MSIGKLFVYKTVTFEVNNVEFLCIDLPLNNRAIMVKWKYLKLLYSSKGMCRIEVNWKKWYAWNIKFLKHRIPFSLYSVGTLVLHMPNTLSPMFSGINNDFSFFGFSNLYFFVFVFTTLKKKIFIFRYF